MTQYLPIPSSPSRAFSRVLFAMMMLFSVTVLPGARGCGGTKKPAICTSDSECNAGKRCESGKCVAAPTGACGDGVKDSAEECDDGNRITEACDYGVTRCTVCSSECNLRPGDTASCGDGRVQWEVEACDDGNTSNTDACLNTCSSAYCGDGVVHAGVELCDDGDRVDNDRCSNRCVTRNPLCGDGTLDEGEQCDDGNRIDNDGCSNYCLARAPTCGDGTVDEGESCDDGNNSNTDLCLTNCSFASCGDGFVHGGVESCDDGNASNTDPCLTTCTVASCGDGFVHAGVEGCDDGNTSNADTCLNDCAIRTPACGDGILDAGEACDDGNRETETCGGSDQTCEVCDATCATITRTCRECLGVYTCDPDELARLCDVPALPEDPADIAPDTAPGLVTNIGTSTEFLYDNPDPVQMDVAPGTINKSRASLIRGKVSTKNRQPLPGVRVTVLDHPEYGWTLTREDGEFDLVVNGGSALVLGFMRVNHLPVQRQVQTQWQEYTEARDVIMLQVESTQTTIDLSGNEGDLQVAQGRVVNDGDGEGPRVGSVIFPAQTEASLVLKDGTRQPLSKMTVRVTEYTEGETGLDAMPGELPSTSGYTYAVELGVDEAVAAGATTVEFDRDLFYYVNNFLGFPVGTPVPVGYYDQEKGKWVPSADGIIIKILSVNAQGLAELDVDGDDAPDGPASLSALGITGAERRTLADLTAYQVGQSLWRVPVRHFTPFDLNWPVGPPSGAEEPPADDGGDNDDDNGDGEDDCVNGCQIFPITQALGEVVPLSGTPYEMVYRSTRVPGRKVDRSVKVKLSGDSITSDLKRIDLRITIAGQVSTQSFAPQANLTESYLWNGKDNYGNQVNGEQWAAIKIDYVYDAFYYEPTGGGASFGGTSGTPTTIPARREISLSREYRKPVGAWLAKSAGFGGWTLSGHHTYDPWRHQLHYGNGESVEINPLDTRIIRHVAGTGVQSYSGNGGAALDAAIGTPTGMVIGPDGSLYFGDVIVNRGSSTPGNPSVSEARIRRIDPAGNISLFAGIGAAGDEGDGGPATDAQLGYVTGLAMDDNGDLYLADYAMNKVRRIALDGTIHLFAGTGESGSSGDGGPATEATFNRPAGVDVGPDGTVYIADSRSHRIRRVSPDGTIHPFAGNGTGGFSGDGGPAAEAELNHPMGVAVADDGSVFIVDQDNHRVRKVSPDGIITTVAGDGVGRLAGNNQPAIDASLNFPIGISLDPNGGFYITDNDNHSIRYVDQAGIMTTVAGTGLAGYAGDDGPANEALLRFPLGSVLSPDGSLFIGEYSSRIRKLEFATPEVQTSEVLVPDPSGDLFYLFDAEGRHLKTLSSLLGTVLLTLEYDDSGRLVRAVDEYNNTTHIERSSEGAIVAVVGPYGHRTSVLLDGAGYISQITNPLNESYHFTYVDEGLMRTNEDPRGFHDTYEYDPLGRLLNEYRAEADPKKTLVRTDRVSGYSVKVTSLEGRERLYDVEVLGEEGIRLTKTSPFGGVTTVEHPTDNELTVTQPDGTVIVTRYGLDPRFRSEIKIPTRMTITTPSGLESVYTWSRAVEFAERDNPLSLSWLEDTSTVNGGVSRDRYDRSLAEWTFTSPLSREFSVSLDEKGEIGSIHEAGVEALHVEYDGRGRTERVWEGGTSSNPTYESRISYDLNGVDGDSISYSTRLNEVNPYTVIFDEAARVRTARRPDGETLGFGYDAAGNVNSITPPGQPAHTMSWSQDDKLLGYSAPDLGGGQSTVEFVEDGDGVLSSVVLPSSEEISFQYYGPDEATPWLRKAMVTPEGEVGYTYYPESGKLHTVTTPGSESVSLSYQYDGFLTTEEVSTGAVSGRLTLGYNSDFVFSSLGVTVGNRSKTVTYTQDADGLLTRAGDSHFQRDLATGQVDSITLHNTTQALNYDSNGLLSSSSYSHFNNSLYQFNVTERDAVGRLRKVEETVLGETTLYHYYYDSAHRLSEVWANGNRVREYTYDANGNRVGVLDLPRGLVIPTSDTAYDAQDRLTRYGDATFTYRGDGQLASKTDGNGDTTQYTYDVQGNLKQVALPNGLVVDYVVDGQNRRVVKKIDGAVAHKYLYVDSLNPIARLDASGQLSAVFVYGSQSHVPDYMVDIGENKTYRYITNDLGTVRLVVDTSSGEVAQRLDYDEFGRVLADTSPGFQPFGFAGGLYDPDTDLVRFGARDYDAEVGRWTAKDPILFAGGQANLYTYVHNDPTHLIDPDGLVGLLPCALAGAVGGAAWEFAEQLWNNNGNLDCVDWGDVATQGAVGGLVGAVSCGLGKLASKAAGKIKKVVRIKPHDKTGGLSVNMGKGNNLRFDFGRLPAAGKSASRIPNAVRGRRMPHYHRRGAGGIRRHRPYERTPSVSAWKFWERF